MGVGVRTGSGDAGGGPAVTGCGVEPVWCKCSGVRERARRGSVVLLGVRSGGSFFCVRASVRGSVRALVFGRAPDCGLRRCVLVVEFLGCDANVAVEPPS